MKFASFIFVPSSFLSITDAMRCNILEGGWHEAPERAPSLFGVAIELVDESARALTNLHGYVLHGMLGI